MCLAQRLSFLRCSSCFLNFPLPNPPPCLPWYATAWPSLSSLTKPDWFRVPLWYLWSEKICEAAEWDKDNVDKAVSSCNMLSILEMAVVYGPWPWYCQHMHWGDTVAVGRHHLSMATSRTDSLSVVTWYGITVVKLHVSLRKYLIVKCSKGSSL